MNLIAKAKELDIPFENFLAGVAREAVFSILLEEDNSLGLKSPGNMEIEDFKKKVNRELLIVVRENGVPLEEMAERLRAVLDGKEDLDLRLNVSAKTDGKTIKADVVLERMYVPLVLRPTFVSEKLRCQKLEYTSIISGKAFSYDYYSGEEQIAENLFEIVKKLELIDDISIVGNLFEEISKSSLEGKRIWVTLKNLSESEGIDINEDYPQRMLALGKNQELRRKWDKYKKRQKNLSINLKDAILLIHNFLKPLWSAIVNGEGFVGDWMPDIGRYL